MADSSPRLIYIVTSSHKKAGYNAPPKRGVNEEETIRHNQHKTFHIRSIPYTGLIL